MHVGIETLHTACRHRQFGDLVQRSLQPLGTVPLDDLGLQHQVGLLQLQRALINAVLELDLGMLAVQCGLDVLGDVFEQRTVFIAVHVGAVVALHHDRAADTIVPAHRHTEPVGTVGAMAAVGLYSQPASQLVRWAKQRLAMMQQRHGEAVGQLANRYFHVRFGNVRIRCVGKIQKANNRAHFVVAHDEEIPGIHQPADHAVDATEHFVHLQPGAGQIGNLVQRLLQALRFFQRFDPRFPMRRCKRCGDRAPSQHQPGITRGRRQCVTQRRGDRNPGLAFIPGRVDLDGGSCRDIAVEAVLGMRMQRRRSAGHGRQSRTRFGVAPAHDDFRAPRQRPGQCFGQPAQVRQNIASHPPRPDGCLYGGSLGGVTSGGDHSPAHGAG